ncbi:MAG: hypothetical protein MH472_14125 [Bacteroidia bacterium]|nr:hypothetical protein [Bacteroidia bacterium]
MTPSQAAKEVNSIRLFIPVLANFRTVFNSIENKEFKEFKITALDFLDTVDHLFNNLQELADIHSSYKISKPVLATDWDSTEDEHWNNY